MREFDIAIVGLGPTGGTLANLFAMHGFSILILDKDDFSIAPGAAVKLQNFEPSIKGGYRRLSGTSKWNTNQVNGDEKILGLKIFNSGVVAAAGNNNQKYADKNDSDFLNWFQFS